MNIDMIDSQAILGGAGAAGAGVYIWSKMRRVLAHDATDASAHTSMKVAMENLRDENTRLHEEVSRLRTEIDRLRETVTSLTTELANMSTVVCRNAFQDQMAREGLIDRRKNRNNDSGK